MSSSIKIIPTNFLDEVVSNQLPFPEGLGQGKLYTLSQSSWSIFFQLFDKPFDIRTQASIPNGPLLYPPSQGYSAFPKGPHQLVSRIPINQGFVRVISRSHQINAYLLLRCLTYFSKVDRFPIGTMEVLNGTVTIVSRLYRRGKPSDRFLRAGGHVPLQLPVLLEFPGSRREFMRNTQSRKNSKERLLRYTFDEPRCKGNQEAFRRVPRDRAETPKSWNKASAYRVHPYWSENLKYVK